MTPTTPTLPTSTFADLAICVRDIFAAIGETATVLFGKRFIAQEGAPRRVVFVADPDRGKWSKNYQLGGAGKGYVGGWDQGGAVYIWGKPALDGDDFESTRDADALTDLVINAMVRAAPGVIDGDQVREVGKPDDEHYGYTYKLRLLLNRGVPRNAPIFALKNTTADPVSPPDPQRPPGTETATLIETDVESSVT